MGKLAITGGKAYRTKPFTAWPIYDKREERALLSVLKSRNWGGYPFPNTYARKFADAFAKAHNAKFGIPVLNGTVTMEIALKAGGINPGDEVIVPALTFVATASAPLFVGAVPVFVDIDPKTYTIDVRKIEEAITRKTRALLPVHLGMQAADLDAVLKIAKKHNLIVIEDCAHAHGGKWRGKGLGSHGDFGSFSFQTSKLMTAGEGGMILTSNEEFQERCESIVNCGRPSARDKYKNRITGGNYRMSEFQAAVLCCQLERLNEQTKKKQQNANVLTNLLSKIRGIKTLKKDPRVTTQPMYQHLFGFIEKEFDGVTRDHFVAALNAEGIPCDGLFYDPVYRGALFHPDKKAHPHAAHKIKEYKSMHLPVAEHVAYHEIVWMSHHLLLGPEKDARDIAGAVQKIVENASELRGLSGALLEEMKTSRVLRKKK